MYDCIHVRLSMLLCKDKNKESNKIILKYTHVLKRGFLFYSCTFFLEMLQKCSYFLLNIRPSAYLSVCLYVTLR
jgi:hypothetical protein